MFETRCISFNFALESKTTTYNIYNEQNCEHMLLKDELRAQPSKLSSIYFNLDVKFKLVPKKKISRN